MTSNEDDDYGLILFMGERVEHALTSIQRYLPSVVHIVTSDKFATKHKRRLKEWSKHYTFRPGTVRSIENLFHKSAVTSILNEVMSIKNEEDLLHDSELIWRIGITGGTMHMAAAGSYAGLILGMKVFYVSMPQGEAKPMPIRDVIELPQLNALGLIMHLPYGVLRYLKLGKGEVKDFVDIIPENLFLIMCDMDLLFFDDKSWFLTEEGAATIELVSNTAMIDELKTEKYGDLEQRLNKVKEENPESFIGWA
jgi:hypothetical protein